MLFTSTTPSRTIGPRLLQAAQGTSSTIRSPSRGSVSMSRVAVMIRVDSPHSPVPVSVSATIRATTTTGYHRRIGLCQDLKDSVDIETRTYADVDKK